MNKLSRAPFLAPLLLLPLILLFSAALRLWITVDKTTIGHDESISYLAATCNQRRYSAESFNAEPQSVAYWKTHFEINDPLCFSEISAGLGQSDIHPPLYFWLLHLWSLIWGVHLWTGPTLNIVLAFLSGLALYRLAQRVWQDQLDRLLVVVTFALSPSMLLISQEARAYDLLMLWVILFIYQTVIIIQNPASFSWKQALFFSLTVTGGMLTHYDFMITVSGGALVILILSLNGRRRRIIPIWGALCVGGLLAFLIHPYLLDSIQTVAGQTPMITWQTFRQRLQNIGVTLAGFAYLLIPLFLLPFFLIRRHQRWRSLQDPALRCLLFFLLWSAAIIFLRYLTFFAPTHTMESPKYLSLVWPLIAFIPSMLRQAMPQWKTLYLYLYIIPLIIGIAFPVFIQTLRAPDPTSELASYKLIILDNTSRGNALPFIWYLQEDQEIIIASQETLYAQASPAWLPPEQEALWIHNVENNAPEKHDALLNKLIDAGYMVEALNETRDLYLIRR